MTSNCINNDVFGSLIGSAMEVLRDQRRKRPFNNIKKKKLVFFWVENPFFLRLKMTLSVGLDLIEPY